VMGLPACHQIQPATASPTIAISQRKRLRRRFRELGGRYLALRRITRFSHKHEDLPKH
jgi:hypothetical protein